MTTEGREDTNFYDRAVDSGLYGTKGVVAESNGSLNMHRALILGLCSTVALAQAWKPVEVPLVKYPCIAVLAQIQSQVVFRFTLDAGGRPQMIRLERGHPMLVRTAEEHLRALHIRASTPVPPGAILRVAYVFRLDPDRKSRSEAARVSYFNPSTFVVQSVAGETCRVPQTAASEPVIPGVRPPIREYGVITVDPPK
jgi:hypothetical protein